MDMIGQKYGHLKVISKAESYSNGQARWNCVCDCGKTSTVSGSNLRRGKQQSCGCMRGGVVTHGKTDSRVFRVWQGMIARCTNPNNKSYERYGARGITVCKRWMQFENFYSDMGDPADGLTLDRIDNDQGYSPENCRWATPRQQANNTRKNRHIETCYGKMTIAEVARRAGVAPGTITHRIKAGVSGEALFAKGTRPGRPRKLVSKSTTC